MEKLKNYANRKLTPKEKAEELVRKMLSKSPNVQDGVSSIDIIQAKLCALVAVDEVMNAPHNNIYMELIPEDADSTDWFWDEFDAYWIDVRKEIEALWEK